MLTKDIINKASREAAFNIETEESGKSELQVQLKSDENLCIANMDKKKTGWGRVCPFRNHARRQTWASWSSTGQDERGAERKASGIEFWRTYYF